LRLLLALAALTGCFGSQPAKVDTSTPIGQAFVRMYNFDFAGAHAILDRQISRDPDFALSYSVKAAAYLFGELHRLKILQMDFFEDDDRVADRRGLAPDPAVRGEFLRMIEAARSRAEARLAGHPEDREALFALCMSAGLLTDYAALVERRLCGSFSLARHAQAYALKRLALAPPYYDAHLTSGSQEYVVGSLYFFVRWFVHIDGIEGNKRKAIEHLQIVAERGRYYGPFARVLLAVIHLREKRPWEAEDLLAGLAKLVREVTALEQQARQLLLETQAQVLFDFVGRAYGALRHVYRLDSQEALAQLSALRLGVDLGMLRRISLGKLNELLIRTQPGHLQKAAAAALDEPGREVACANLIRDWLHQAAS